MNVIFEVVPIPVQRSNLWQPKARVIQYYPAVWVEVGGYGTYMVFDNIQGRVGLLDVELFAPDSQQEELPYTYAKNFINDPHLRDTVEECLKYGTEYAQAFIEKLKARGGDFPEHYQFSYENTQDHEGI
jgi:hypothetical protein